MDSSNKKRKAEAGASGLRGIYHIWKAVYGTLKVIFGAVATVALICLICMFVFVNIVAGYLEEDIMPNADISLGDHDVELNSFLYCVDDGEFVMYQKIFATVNREWATYEQIPQNMVNAAIAIEDHRFYEHQGVDWITTFKAIVRMFFGNADAGGSSITQQLIKNVTGESGVTVQRKVLEIFKAMELERKYTKEQIMEQYLNEIYLGQSCYGVRAAAAAYFGKELEKLTLAECASIISITNAPTFYDPYQNFDNNKDRKEDVLWSMRNQGLITEDEYQEALNQELVLKRGISLEDTMVSCKNESCSYRDVVSTLTHKDNKYYCPNCGDLVEIKDIGSEDVYSWYTDTVLEDVAMALAEKDGMEWNRATRQNYMQRIQSGGYHIYTCLDLDVQAQVDKIYKDLNQIPADRSGQQLQSAIVIKSNESNDIIALAGGVGPNKEFDDWNRATDGELQSGSAIKPITIYAPAFESGKITPATVIKDMPLSYNIVSTGPYPKNDDREYDYSKTIFAGVTSSTNAVAAQTLHLIGSTYSFDFAKDRFGISTLVDNYTDKTGKVHSDKSVAALALGAQTWGVTVRDMADAFGTFTNDGEYVKGRTFTRVYDSNGNLVIDNTQQTREIISTKTVDYMNYCLVNATRNGTGKEADLSRSLGISTAGKTGTTANAKDRWYCGFTGYYTAAVWVGYDSPEVIRLVNGGNPAAQLWKKVMQPLHKGLSNRVLYNAGAMKNISVCLDSGLRATDACGLDIRDLDRVAVAPVYPGDGPKGVCEKHVMVEYCTTGEGVANEYCKHFAEVDPNVKIEKKSLVKMTQEELEEILKAERHGLDPLFLMDQYVYLIDANGNDKTFKGFHNDANYGEDAPYIVCKTHTKQAWEKYEKDHPSEDGSEEDNFGGIIFH